MRRKNTFKYLLIALPILAMLGWALYQLPPVQQRLRWRIDVALTYLRGAINPVSNMPTPLAQGGGTLTPTLLPTATATPDPALASPTPTQITPSPTPTSSPTPLPGTVALSQPEYEKQGPNNCGPATLSMYLRYYGWQGNQKDITDKIKPFEGDRNVNVEELAYFVNNFAGWLRVQYRVGGDIPTLKKFLAAGYPVLIEGETDVDQQYWPSDDLWAGHYLLVTGYDDQTQMMIVMDAYRDYNKQMSYPDFLADWQSFNYVYIVVYPVEQEATIQALMGDEWSMDTNRQRALEKARAEAAADPDSAFAWFNLGSNQVYFGQYSDAALAYDQARALELPQRMLRYQFGPFFAYFHSGRLDDLLALTDYALKVTPNSEEAMLWKGWALYRKGDTPGAIELFRKSYAANPTSPDAVYALDFVGTSP
ncbi:MAG: C39 family peptidase [Anaerolineales bacterium]|nr:C39 family peptidase [Anaerolineales bacterium]